MCDLDLSIIIISLLMEIVLLVGLPGAGKSTFCKGISGYQVIEFDLIEKGLGSEFTIDKWHEAR